jgi:hypothetical protein
VTRQIELERAKAYIEEHVRYTYACPHCRDGGQMLTTSKPPVPLEKSPFGASVLAWIIAAKHERHLPTYRASRCRAGPAEVLANYQGVLLTDGFSGYESLVCESQGRLFARPKIIVRHFSESACAK